MIIKKGNTRCENIDIIASQYQNDRLKYVSIIFQLHWVQPNKTEQPNTTISLFNCYNHIVYERYYQFHYQLLSIPLSGILNTVINTIVSKIRNTVIIKRFQSQSGKYNMTIYHKRYRRSRVR